MSMRPHNRYSLESAPEFQTVAPLRLISSSLVRRLRVSLPSWTRRIFRGRSRPRLQGEGMPDAVSLLPHSSPHLPRLARTCPRLPRRVRFYSLGSSTFAGQASHCVAHSERAPPFPLNVYVVPSCSSCSVIQGPF